MAYQAVDDHGIDVFSGSVVINWGLVENDGIQMVYIKATEGIAYTNPIMASQYQGATAAGILIGFYHFAATNNPIAEYQYFMNSISKFKQDLKPCLDYEIINTDYGFINQFMSQNPNLILYAPHSIADNTGFPINKIWIPEPNTFPATTRGYVGIQYSSTGIVNGISNDVSLDIFDSDVLLSNVTPPSPEIPGNLAVYTIQLQLNTMTLAKLVADGVLGPLTTTKIKQFEQIVGITVDGIWGPQCVNATAKIYAKPLCGLPYHEPIPTRLIQFRVGTSIDGIFGTITANSVKVWQKSNGLVPDGIFGPLSWGKLLI
jgi:lysozyme